MSLTQVALTSIAAPASYAWEATSEAISTRYGIPLEQVARFDLNTAPAPPELAQRILGTGQFDVPLSEYPPADYRRLVAAAATRYGVATDEILVGAGADEALDLAAKAFLPPGGRSVIPEPTYSMYRVLTEQRPATATLVRRQGADAGYAVEPDLVRDAARGADLVWLCSPNNPTGLPEPRGVVAALLADLLEEASEHGTREPVVVLDEAYAEFAGETLVGLRSIYPRLVVIRTLSKAYALAGLRVGFAIARAETIAAMASYRPPGSVTVVSATVAADVLGDTTLPRASVRSIVAERERLAVALRHLDWLVRPSVTNFLLVDFGSPHRAAVVAEAMLAQGLVLRTFPAGHQLASHLRITVRDRRQDDRLVAAAAKLAPSPRSGEPSPGISR